MPAVVVGPYADFPAALMRRATTSQASLATLGCECPVAAGKGQTEEEGVGWLLAQDRGLPTFPCAQPELFIVAGSNFFFKPSCLLPPFEWNRYPVKPIDV